MRRRYGRGPTISTERGRAEKRFRGNVSTATPGVSASVVAVVDNEAVQTIPTPGGAARAVVSAAASPSMTLVLGHGAGGGIEARDLVALARDLPGRGVTVVRVEQPWRVAGRKVAGPPPTLDKAWLAVLEALDVAGPLVVGGRSAGARVACRTATQVGAVGCLALAFPLHPPGKPLASRAEELRAPVPHGIPLHVLQGETDPFGTPDEVRAELPDPSWVTVVKGGHGFTRKPDDVVAAAVAFVRSLG
jgi:predicted alpha/beta-hydrolase family hydrolase